MSATSRPGARLALALLAAVAAASLAPAGNASWLTCNALLLEAGTGDAPSAYVVFDWDPYWGSYSMPWVYAESNGIRHLQRGGLTLLGDVDPCAGALPPDSGIF